MGCFMEVHQPIKKFDFRRYESMFGSHCIFDFVATAHPDLVACNPINSFFAHRLVFRIMSEDAHFIHGNQNGTITSIPSPVGEQQIAADTEYVYGLQVRSSCFVIRVYRYPAEFGTPFGPPLHSVMFQVLGLGRISTIAMIVTKTGVVICLGQDLFFFCEDETSQPDVGAIRSFCIRNDTLMEQYTPWF